MNWTDKVKENLTSIKFWWGSVTAGNYAEYRQTVDIPSQ